MSRDLVVSLRVAREDDIATLREIEHAADQRFLAVGHPEMAATEAIPEDVARRALATGRLVVAEVRVGRGPASIAGFTYVGRVDDELYLGQISVAPAWGRQGIGTLLLNAVIESARTAGEPSLALATQSDVAWNAPWYARHGFELVPREEWSEGMRRLHAGFLEEGLDEATRVFMRRVLR